MHIRRNKQDVWNEHGPDSCDCCETVPAKGDLRWWGPFMICRKDDCVYATIQWLADERIYQANKVKKGCGYDDDDEC